MEITDLEMKIQMIVLADVSSGPKHRSGVTLKLKNYDKEAKSSAIKKMLLLSMIEIKKEPHNPSVGGRPPMVISILEAGLNHLNINRKGNPRTCSSIWDM